MAGIEGGSGVTLALSSTALGGSTMADGIDSDAAAGTSITGIVADFSGETSGSTGDSGRVDLGGTKAADSPGIVGTSPTGEGLAFAGIVA